MTIQNIETNQWYRFKTLEDKHKWLKILEHYGVTIHTYFLSKECLCLKNMSNQYMILYRTKYYIGYTEAIYWEPIKETIKEGVKEMNIQEFLLKKEVEATVASQKQNRILSLEFRKKTEAGKILLEAIEKLNKQKDVDVRFENVFSDYMMSDSDTENVTKEEENLSNKTKEISAKFTELKVLINMTQTYEQRIDLLKKFGILDFLGCTEKGRDIKC